MAPAGAAGSCRHVFVSAPEGMDGPRADRRAAPPREALGGLGGAGGSGGAGGAGGPWGRRIFLRGVDPDGAQGAAPVPRGPDGAPGPAGARGRSGRRGLAVLPARRGMTRPSPAFDIPGPARFPRTSSTTPYRTGRRPVSNSNAFHQQLLHRRARARPAKLDQRAKNVPFGETLITYQGPAVPRRLEPEQREGPTW